MTTLNENEKQSTQSTQPAMIEIVGSYSKTAGSYDDKETVFTSFKKQLEADSSRTRIRLEKLIIDYDCEFHVIEAFIQKGLLNSALLEMRKRAYVELLAPVMRTLLAEEDPNGYNALTIAEAKVRLREATGN